MDNLVWFYVSMEIMAIIAGIMGLVACGFKLWGYIQDVLRWHKPEDRQP
jgi:hypothetical protein